MDVRLGLTGEDAIYQNIRTILFGERGSIVLRPNMCVGQEYVLDAKSDAEIAMLITEQIEKYEPRVRIKNVKVWTGDNISQKRIRLVYNIAGYEGDFQFFEEV